MAISQHIGYSVSLLLFAVVLLVQFSLSVSGADTGNRTNNLSGGQDNETVHADWTVNFTATPMEGYPPLCVQFTAQGPNGDLVWDFGDGATSMVRNPVHCYTTNGTFPVRMKYSVGKITGEVTKPDYITVKDPRTFVDFKATPVSGTAPLTTQFTLTGSPTNIVWNFGDRSDLSSDQNPQHQYVQPGNYSPMLTYCLDGVCNRSTKYYYITVLPGGKMDFTAEKQNGTAPICTKFVPSGEADSFTWDFGDGGYSDEKTPVHCFNEPGKYTVTMTYVRDGASYPVTKEGYITTASRDIPDFTVNPRNGTAPLCVDLLLTGATPQNWTWFFGDNATGTGAYTSHCYGNPGTYDLSLAYCNNGLCSSVNKSRYVQVQQPMVQVNETANRSTFRFTTDAGAGLKYFWDFGDGMTAEMPGPEHTYVKEGKYHVTLSVLGNCGCIAKSGVDVSVRPSGKADFTATPLAGCAPHCVQFHEESPESPVSRAWDFGDGQQSSETNPFHCYEKPGVYSITLSEQYADRKEDVVKDNYISVSGMPSPSFTAFPTSGEAPLTVTFTDTTSSHESKRFWQFDDGSTATENRVEHIFEKEGVYNVSLTVWGDGQCYDSANQKVVVDRVEQKTYNLSGVPLRGYAPLCTSFKIDGNPNQWKVAFGDGESSSDINPFHCYATPGIFSPSLHACNGSGCEDIQRADYVVAYPAEYQNLTLQPGWNLVSVPLTLQPGYDTLGLFSTVNTRDHSIFSYDGRNSQWKRLSANSSLDPLSAFWIYAADQVSIPLQYATDISGVERTRSLSAGWNLVSYADVLSLPASEAFQSVSDSWGYIIGYDAVNQRYDEQITNGVESSQMLSPKQGYWIYMNSPGVLKGKGI